MCLCAFLYRTLQTSYYCSHSDAQIQRNWYSPSDLISSFYSHSPHLLLLTQVILLSICSICMIRSCLNISHTPWEHSTIQNAVAISLLRSYTTPGSILAPIRFANEILTALTYNTGQVSVSTNGGKHIAPIATPQQQTHTISNNNHTICHWSCHCTCTSV